MKIEILECIDDTILLEQSINRIYKSKGKVVDLGSNERKNVLTRVLRLYNITFLETPGRNNKIIIEPYYSKKIYDICSPEIKKYKNQFRMKLKNIVSDFFKNNLEPVNKRLLYLFCIMKEIKSAAKIETLNGNLEKISNRKNIIFYSTNFFILTHVLIKIFNAINESKLISRYELLKEWENQITNRDYFFSVLKSILGDKLILFNIIRKDLPVENNYVKIPKAIQNILNMFEIRLRQFLIKILLEQDINEINTFFPKGKFRSYKKSAKKELIESGKKESLIEKFSNSKFTNEKHLKLIFESMTNSDYYIFMKHNQIHLPSSIQQLNYEEDFKKIGKLRNIPAHNKTDAERKISQYTDLLYKYLNIFNLY